MLRPALLAGIASAATMTMAATTTTTSAAATHTVAVGARGFMFEPDNIKASVGDTIEFNFYPGGHSVVRSDYEKPCIPYELTGPNRVGFWSGFQTPQVYSSEGPKYRVRVNDTDPVFFYCSAPNSCIEHQMIGVINERENATLKVQREYAINSTFQLNPGDPLPSETAGTKPKPSSDSETGSHSHGSSGLSGGAIAGIAIGGAAVLVLVGALLYLCGRRERLDSLLHGRDRTSYAAPPSVAPMSETKYDPRSPGPEAYQSHSLYPYGLGPHSPPLHSQYSGTPPPTSPGHPSYNSHQGYAAPQPGQAGYYPHPSPPPPPAPPVELAGSADPGNSPLPSYRQERQLSWGRGTENSYRPGNK